MNSDLKEAILAECPRPPLKVKIGMGNTTTNDAPAFYQYDIDKGEYVGGFEYKFAKTLCNESNFLCEFIPLNSLEDRFIALHTSRVDVTIWRLSYSKDRRYKIRYIEPFYYSDNGQLFARKPLPEQLANPDTVPSMNDLVQGKVLCILEGFYLTQELTSYGAEILKFNDTQGMIDTNLRGRCDYICSDGSSIYELGDRYAAVPMETTNVINPYGVAVAYFSTDLADILQNSLRKMFTNARGLSKVQQIEQETLLSMEPPFVKSKYIQRQAMVQTVYSNAFYQSDFLRVGMVQGANIAPFRTWTNGYTVKGFERELAEKLCLHLNVNCVILPLPDISSRVTSLQNGTVDVVISAFSVTFQRLRQVRFIEPFYYSSYPAFFTLEDNAAQLSQTAKAKGGKVADTLTGLKLCMDKSYFMQETISRLVGDEQIVTQYNTSTPTVNLEDGTCDILVKDNIWAYELKKAGVLEIQNLEQLANAPFAVGMGFDADPTLVDNVGRIMKEITFFNLQSQLQQLIEEEIVQASNQTILPNEFVTSFIELARVNQATCTEYIEQIVQS